MDEKTGRSGLASRWRGLRDAARLSQRVMLRGVPRGLLALGAGAARGLAREGPRDLHWKAGGDALVQIFRSGGPALNKLGQVLATRGDLLPAAVCERLEALYDRQPPMSHAQLRRLLARNFGRKRPFRRLERKPLAVGSIGQVHRAQLRDGRRVVVKLLRPDVRESLESDLRALRTLAEFYLGLATRGRPELRELAQRALADFEAGLLRETDLAHEADALESFGRRFARSRRVRVPDCHREWCTSEVLVIEELVGRPLSEVRRSDPEAARKVAGVALRELLGQVFDHGSYHADPHAGNLLLLDDGRLGLIDLGLTGELTREDRRHIARAARAILGRDPDRAMRALLEFGSLAEGFDHDAFRRDVTEVIRSRKGPRTEALDVLVQDLLAVAARHGVALPPSTTLLIKTLVTIEGVARSLDPELDVLRVAVPVVLRSMTPKLLRWRFWSGERSEPGSSPA